MLTVEDCIKAAEQGKEVHVNDGQVVILGGIRMIKIENGKLEIKGTPYEICADISTIIRGARISFAKDFGEELAENMVKRAYELSWMSDEQVKVEADKAKERVMKKFNQGLMATLAKAMLMDDRPL